MRRTVHKFRAGICKSAVNACVAVPERLSRSLRPYAQAGRIEIEGKINGSRMRATLMPVVGGRHRLYVNGGMRAGARVNVGDTVEIVLWPAQGKVTTPPDVAAGLRSVEGAEAAFEALSRSHRRELVRYIDDARTPDSRRRRIERAAGHVVGKSRPGSSGGGAKPLWTCPECGNRFVNRNQYHSCARHRLADVFAGKATAIRQLFERFREMVEGFGPVTLLLYRDRIGLMVRVRFAGATPKARWLDIDFWLRRRIDHPRFRKVETIYPNAHIHHLRVTRLEELDDHLASWLREAYAVGCQEE